MSLFKKKVPEVSDEEKNERPVPVNKNVEKLKTLLKTYAPSIISILALAIVIPVSNMIILGQESETLSEKEQKLVEINNEIYKLNESERQVQYVVKDADADLNKDVWSEDDKYFYNFVKDAFSYTGLDEYKTMRKKYIDILNRTNGFVKNCLPAMNVSGDAYNNGIYEGDAENLVSCVIKSMKSDIFKIDKNKYTYVAQLQIRKKVYDAKGKAMRSVDVTAVCTYSIYHSDGERTLDITGINGCIMR